MRRADCTTRSAFSLSSLSNSCSVIWKGWILMPVCASEKALAALVSVFPGKTSRMSMSESSLKVLSAVEPKIITRTGCSVSLPR